MILNIKVNNMNNTKTDIKSKEIKINYIRKVKNIYFNFNFNFFLKLYH